MSADQISPFTTWLPLGVDSKPTIRQLAEGRRGKTFFPSPHDIRPTHDRPRPPLSPDTAIFRGRSSDSAFLVRHTLPDLEACHDYLGCRACNAAWKRNLKHRQTLSYEVGGCVDMMSDTPILIPTATSLERNLGAGADGRNM